VVAPPLLGELGLGEARDRDSVQAIGNGS
jgi:hypothetical protein